MSKFFSTFFWNIRGRVTRPQYWKYFAIMMAYSIVVVSIIIVSKEIGGDPDVLIGVLAISYIPLMWSGVIVSVKRVRDTGLSIWWYGLQLIPYVGIVAGIVFALIPSNYFPRPHKSEEVVLA